jgi:Ca2+-binding EF-hand superfamily protein
MKRPKISLLATLCALALGSAGAWAHDNRPGYDHDLPGCGVDGWPYGPFAQVDTNGDGYADRTEVVASSPWYPYYTPMDADHDGRISRAEADAYTMSFHGWPYGPFVQVDTNGDGYADRTEVVAGSPWYPYYGAIDADHDGRISRAEADAYTMAWRPDAWPYGTFVQVDTNGDGFVDRTEVVDTSPWYPYYGAIDANGDGRITRAEADLYTGRWRPGPWPGWTFVGVDTNHDGFIDRTEVVAGSPMYPHFDAIDSNDDGRATQEEIETFWRTMAHSPRGDCSGMAMAHDAGADAPRDVSDKGIPPSFRSSDKDGDGFLARDEIAPGDMLLTHFNAADTNNDGRLSAGEVDAHRAAMAEMGKDEH